jgi:hypothetical protein
VRRSRSLRPAQRGELLVERPRSVCPGDLVARTGLGRMLSVLEALLGQIYLVTVVALVVGNVGRPPRRRSGAGGVDGSG